MIQQHDWHNKCFYRVTLKAVIFDDQGRVLVVREKNNTNWNLPGGGMDYGEDEHEALRRELLEEVGYTGDFTHTPLGIHPKYLEAKQAWLLWIVYRINPATLDFSIGDEADEIAWLHPEEFRDYHVPIYEFCSQAQAVERRSATLD